MVGPPPPRCTACGDVIGMYEPIVSVDDGVATHTSRAATPGACAAPGAHCYHRACWSDSPVSAAG